MKITSISVIIKNVKSIELTNMKYSFYYMKNVKNIVIIEKKEFYRMDNSLSTLLFKYI